jgi:hypothetical protein
MHTYTEVCEAAISARNMEIEKLKAENFRSATAAATALASRSRSSSTPATALAATATEFDQGVAMENDLIAQLVEAKVLVFILCVNVSYDAYTYIHTYTHTYLCVYTCIYAHIPTLKYTYMHKYMFRLQPRNGKTVTCPLNCR